MLLHRLVVTIASCPQRGGDVESARAIIDVQIIGQRVTILIHAVHIVLKTEALALCLLQRDAHYSLCRGSIAGTWILYYINVLYLVGAEAREFVQVLYPPSVDIHLGFATSQNFYTATALSFERRNFS